MIHSPMVLLIYRTPTGRISRRKVPHKALHATIRILTAKGYTGFVAI